MIEIGRLCMKIAGRDAGKRCVVVDVISNNMVMIDGETRRRKCSTKHLEPLEQVIKIKKGTSHSDISKELKKLGIESRETKPRKADKKPTKVRGKDKKTAAETESSSSAKAPKKTAEKETKKAAEEKPKQEKKETKPAAKKPAKKSSE